MTDWDAFRRDYTDYLLETRGHFNAPLNKLIFSAFDSFRRNMNVDVIDARFTYLDRLYQGGLSNYVAKSKPYKCYFNVNNTRAVASIRWLVQELENANNLEFLVEKLTFSNKKRPSYEQIFSTTDLIVEAAAIIRDECCWSRKTFGPISFCSKYAHFAGGVAPIFDSNVFKSVYRMKKGRWPNRNYINRDYQAFVADFLEVFFAVSGRRPFSSKNIKNLDGYLYVLGREERQWPTP